MPVTIPTDATREVAAKVWVMSDLQTSDTDVA